MAARQWSRKIVMCVSCKESVCVCMCVRERCCEMQNQKEGTMYSFISVADPHRHDHSCGDGKKCW